MVQFRKYIRTGAVKYLKCFSDMGFFDLLSDGWGYAEGGKARITPSDNKKYSLHMYLQFLFICSHSTVKDEILITKTLHPKIGAEFSW